MSTGLITSTAPVTPVKGAPGSFTAIAGSISCTVTGNASPATGATISCSLGTTAIPDYTVPLAASTAFTFTYNFNGDALTVILDALSGSITWQATAAPVGGTATSANGTL